MRPLNILTWNVHGNYLYYFSHIPHQIFLPVNKSRTGDYCGIGKGFKWGSNVIEVPVADVPSLKLDCIVFQRDQHYIHDQHYILSEKQRRLPKIFIEHDPPRKNPTDTRHCVFNTDVLLVHVTNYNSLMWDSGNTPKTVISHGIVVPDDAVYSGKHNKGIVVINHLKRRGRRLGADIFKTVRRWIALDLIGMEAENFGGIGEIPHDYYPYFLANYRFFFNPIRYTSLGLAVCEAMMIGLPVIGLATTEMSMIIKNYQTGYIDTNIDNLVEFMELLIHEPDYAKKLGNNCRQYAQKYFGIKRFVSNWEHLFKNFVGAPEDLLKDSSKETRGICLEGKMLSSSIKTGQ
ncbi:MAG: glycosyltransferase [Candidatus Omnitrophota bacterium]